MPESWAAGGDLGVRVVGLGLPAFQHFPSSCVQQAGAQVVLTELATAQLHFPAPSFLPAPLPAQLGGSVRVLPRREKEVREVPWGAQRGERPWLAQGRDSTSANLAPAQQVTCTFEDCFITLTHPRKVLLDSLKVCYELH